MIDDQKIESIDVRLRAARMEIETLCKERDEAKGKITRMRDGYEGCCPLCETVGILNVKLLAERDAARREVCEMPPRLYIKQAYEYAYLRGWDCYEEK